VAVSEEATADLPPRKRSSWSLRTIVEDVSGRPIDDFQEPGRPVHPYLNAKPGPPSGFPARPAAPTPGRSSSSLSGTEPYDPVAHLYPPLVGAPAREYHGPEHEHHAETLARHPAATPGVGERPRGSGPLHRPERLYLHYLLLHLDRLSDAALAYLRAAVEEEAAHRARSSAAAAAASAPAPPVTAEAPAPAPSASAPPPVPPPTLPAT
jgi:hypothetical protein